MAKQLKKWQGWLLFGGAMFIIFVLGMLCSSMYNPQIEIVSPAETKQYFNIFILKNEMV